MIFIPIWKVYATLHVKYFDMDELSSKTSHKANTLIPHFQLKYLKYNTI